MMTHFQRDSKGMFRFILSILFILAIPIVLYSLLSCRGRVEAEEHYHREHGPRPGHISRFEGPWFFKAYIHTGRLELYWTRNGWAGRILFDSRSQWEELTDISIDPRTGEVQFHRRFGNQQYSGTLSDHQIAGTFFTPGIGSFPWNAWRP
jgi:hypothetical protein